MSLEESIYRRWEGWRIDAQTILSPLASSETGEVVLNELPPTSAEPIVYLFNVNDLNNPIDRPDYLVADHGSYVVISLYNQPFSSALLINVDTKAVHVIENTEQIDCCRFSEDGTQLRYIVG